jgi:YD repeat-containing protein
MGQSHAENMAANGYMGHVQPDGDTIEYRYDARGLLPECRLPIRGSNRFYPGAENAYQGHVDTTIEREYAADTYVGSEQELARVMFDSWMNSPPHREAMLLASADQMGLGVAITGDDRVYAALELC